MWASRRLAMIGLIVMMVAGWMGSALADAPKRVALVIGNGDYQFAPKLDNPRLDAKAVAASLQRIGFQVTEGYDLSISDMRTTLAKFTDTLPGSSAALIYYAGHGVSVDDENYLLPVDLRLRNPTDLDLDAMSLSLVMRQLRRDERVNIVILDACRDNPFAAELARAKSRAVIGERGLSRIDGDLARGALIAFASDPRSVALDGPPGEHSPFTKALLNHIADPDISIDTAMSRVRSDVWSETKNQQLPWVNTSIIGEFDLNPTPKPSVVAVTPPSQPGGEAREDLLWESAQHSNLSSDYRAYLDAYPSGAFAPMARNRIAALETSPAAPMVRTSAGPNSPSPTLKTEVADEAAERSLGLDFAARKEIQLRLNLLGVAAGVADGEFADTTRAAIRNWQQRKGLEPSGYLAPLQYVELNSESEARYQHFLNTQASLPPASAVHSLPPAPATQAKPRAMTPLIRKPVAVERKRRDAAKSSDEPSLSPPAQSKSSAEAGPCQTGFHMVKAPNWVGYRCVQDGY